MDSDCLQPVLWIQEVGDLKERIVSMDLVGSLSLNEAKGGQNLVYSPFSINAALALLASGSSGRTLQQMLKFLKSEDLDHLNSDYSRIINLTRFGTISGGPKLSFISGVWVDHSCTTLKPTFQEIARLTYKAEAKSVDFKTKAEEVREAVNKWVEENTNGLIRNLLCKGSIHGGTRLLLANALYFKGSWERSFDRSQTKNSKFYLLDGSSVQVPFMTSKAQQYVSCYEGFKVLQLPYKQAPRKRKRFNERRHLSMYIILPDWRDGLPHLIEKVSSNSARFLDFHLPLNQEQVIMGDFRIPKFKISFDFEVSSVLKKMGLVLPFLPEAAEFTEMVNGNGNLSVDKVIHKCFVEVDEEGTEAAAAATSLVFMICDSPRVNFVADHPFMFIIRDNQTGVVLFTGYVVNPLGNG